MSITPRLPSIILCAFCTFLRPNLYAATSDPLPQLVQILSENRDPQFQLDILRGLSAAVRGQRSVPMPKGWESVETKLSQSLNPDIRTLVESLSLTFGSEKALASLKKTLVDDSAELGARRAALDSLLSTRDASLPSLLQQLLKNTGLRGQAIRALTSYDDAKTPDAILSVYSSLTDAEKRDALNALASRVTYAKSLMASIGDGRVAKTALTADLIRQLRNLKNDDINAALTKVYGTIRDANPDKQKEIQRYVQLYRAGGSQPGEASRGRVVYNKVCAQCHALFDEGGKVGPDITGANRADLNYLLETILDPNAVIPNDYRASTIETKDGRSITGIVKQQDDKAVTIATPTETLVLPRNEIDSIQQSELSMMPEGLLAPLADQEVRDLIYYLGRSGQVPLPSGGK
ncbi:MAG TPA: c-type cytochrome [Verrucomicrobiae bacterium]|nr:c-type cytochrome [Verrucomicrobiae bacterium]